MCSKGLIFASIRKLSPLKSPGELLPSNGIPSTSSIAFDIDIIELSPELEDFRFRTYCISGSLWVLQNRRFRLPKTLKLALLVQPGYSHFRLSTAFFFAAGGIIEDS
eukprot:CAMPEP_0170123166 /NCGR_PEP_ID=MMETSP0020_2-20130122/17269_1 /TAXON_ID=98059 /ORGANISM="Dinobryon sp., Strain UTEXLB2267" /LENGTH=106 /DNA_ID=CAMNT_0010354555 /DNA_START=216 /DNA_END=536 /DNA_ORIENTATION=-